MPIAFDSGAGARDNGVSSATITLSWGVAPASEAQMLVHLVTTTVGGTLTLPDGSWVVVKDTTNAGSTLRTVVCRRRYTTGDPTSYSFVWSSTRLVRGGLTAYTGAHPDAPLDAGPTTAEGTGTAVTHGLTTGTAGALVLGFVGKAVSSATTPSAGWTERQEVGGVCSLQLSEQAAPAAGAVSGTWTQSVATATLVTLLSLRDAAAPGAGALTQRWTGSAWQAATVQRWTGSAWQAATVKRWDGTSWD